MWSVCSNFQIFSSIILTQSAWLTQSGFRVQIRLNRVEKFVACSDRGQESHFKILKKSRIFFYQSWQNFTLMFEFKSILIIINWLLRKSLYFSNFKRNNSQWNNFSYIQTWFSFWSLGKMNRWKMLFLIAWLHFRCKSFDRHSFMDAIRIEQSVIE